MRYSEAARTSEDATMRELIEELDKYASLVISATSNADRQRYCQQIMHTGEDLVNVAAAVADTSAEGGCIR